MQISILQELRSEDYSSNQKSKQAGGGTTGVLFGAGSSTQQTSTGGSGFVFGGGMGSGGLQTSTTGFGGKALQ